MEYSVVTGSVETSVNYDYSGNFTINLPQDVIIGDPNDGVGQ